MANYLDPTTYNQSDSSSSESNYLDPSSYQTPQDIENAKQYLGSNVDSGYCESFVEAATNGQNWGDSASSAWENQLNAGLGRADPSLQGAKAGDKIYFNDPSQPNGHVGILVDPSQGTFISAEPDGVKIDTLSHWLPFSGQQITGYVPVQ